MTPRNKANDNFERKGGYAGPRVQRTDLKPPPASATSQQTTQPAPSNSDGPSSSNSGTSD